VPHLHAGSTLDGRVIVAGSGERPKDMGLGLFTADGDHEAWTRPKKDGTFEMRPVPDGTFALQVYGLESGWFIKSARIGAHDVLEEGLEVEKGATGGRLEVVLSSACPQLEGSVIEDDQPLTGRARSNLTGARKLLQQISSEPYQDRPDGPLFFHLRASRQVPGRGQVSAIRGK